MNHGGGDDAIRTSFITLASGNKLHYRTAGTGTVPIIFLHGYSFSSSLWTKVLGQLPPQYRGYALDVRGFGLSDKPEDGYAFGSLAAELVDFMDALQIGKAVLAGHSMGGMIIQTLMLSQPERVSAFVISDSMAMTEPAAGLIPRIQQQIDAYGSPEANRRIFEAATPRFFDSGNLTDEDRDAFVAVNLQAGNAALKQIIRHVFTYETIDAQRFAKVTVPGLIVIGSHDLISFSAVVSLNDAFPNSEIFIVERSGHSPMWERAERWCFGVFGFLHRQAFKPRDKTG